MVFSRSEMAATLGVHERTIDKAIAKHRRITGDYPPGMMAGNQLTDEFMGWFHGRQDAKPGLQGLSRDGGRKPSTFKPPQRAHVPAQITGLTPSSRIHSEAELWEQAISVEQKGTAKAEARYDQRVTIPDDKPVLVVLFADLHLGNAHCAYSRAKADAELVRDTPGVYGIALGDLIDNWVSLNPKILGIQRQQPMQHSDELALLESWIGMVREKLIAVVAGNHELRTYDLAGVDLIQRALGNATVLYDQYEIKFTLTLGEASWRWKVRHSWPGKSQMNETYSFEKDSRWNDGTWDIGVGGHWHPTTLIRPFTDKAHDNARKYAVQLGSYEFDSAFARKCGLPRSNVGGSGAMMLWPDGRAKGFDSDDGLEMATRFLAMERAR